MIWLRNQRKIRYRIFQLRYEERAYRIPAGFAKVCDQQGWERVGTWLKLAGPDAVWYEAPSGAYIYFNNADGQWWIDAPEGHGVYVAKGKDALTKGPAGLQKRNRTYRRDTRIPNFGEANVRI